LPQCSGTSELGEKPPVHSTYVCPETASGWSWAGERRVRTRPKTMSRNTAGSSRTRAVSSRRSGAGRPNLGFVRDFIQALADNLSSELPDERQSPFPSFVSQPDEGSLFLTEQEAGRYRDTVDELHRLLAPREDLSEATVDAALRSAIFETLDLQERCNADFASRLDAAIDKIAALASLPVADYDCLIEICGLETESRPARFGSVRFVHFSEHQLRKLRRRVRPGERGDAGRHRFVRETIARLREHCFGSVRVRARDARAAEALAKRRVRAAADCLNFFSDLVPFNHGWVFLPGDGERRATISTVIRPDGSLWCRMFRTRPIGLFSMAKLRASRHLRSTVKRVSGLLKRERNAVEELLVTSVQIAGQATVATRAEDAFLLYTMALESLILPKANMELRHRLAQRVARLLGRGTCEREGGIVKCCGSALDVIRRPPSDPLSPSG